MPSSLKEETALLLEDYFQHRGGGAALPPSPTAATLRRAAAELERRERPFFRSCAPLARAEPREAAALLERVAAQLEAEGGLNWGRLLALVVFAGTLAAALTERGCGDGPRCLAAALAAYLAEERGEWLEAHGGWVSGDRGGGAGGGPAKTEEGGGGVVGGQAARPGVGTGRPGHRHTPPPTPPPPAPAPCCGSAPGGGYCPGNARVFLPALGVCGTGGEGPPGVRGARFAPGGVRGAARGRERRPRVSCAAAGRGQLGWLEGPAGGRGVLQVRERPRRLGEGTRAHTRQVCLLLGVRSLRVLESRPDTGLLPSAGTNRRCCPFLGAPVYGGARQLDLLLWFLLVPQLVGSGPREGAGSSADGRCGAAKRWPLLLSATRDACCKYSLRGVRAALPAFPNKMSAIPQNCTFPIFSPSGIFDASTNKH